MKGTLTLSFIKDFKCRFASKNLNFFLILFLIFFYFLHEFSLF